MECDESPSCYSVYFRHHEPTTHTQPSIIRIDDEENDESSSESEHDDSILITTDSKVSPIENDVSVRNV